MLSCKLSESWVLAGSGGAGMCLVIVALSNQANVGQCWARGGSPVRGGRLFPKPSLWGPLSAPPVSQERFPQASSSAPCSLSSDLASGRARRTVFSYKGPVAEGARERKAGRGPGSQGGSGSSREDSPSSSRRIPVQEPRQRGLWMPLLRPRA